MKKSDPESLGSLLVFPFSLALPGKSKMSPDPGRNLHIACHTAEPYSNYEVYRSESRSTYRQKCVSSSGLIGSLGYNSNNEHCILYLQVCALNTSFDCL